MSNFCIHTQNGKEYYSIEHHDDGNSREAFLGSFKRFPITEEQLALGLNELTKIYRQKDEDDKKPSWEKDPALKAAMIERIAVIITQLKDDDGTKDVARRQYKKLTGVDFKL